MSQNDDQECLLCGMQLGTPIKLSEDSPLDAMIYEYECKRCGRVKLDNWMRKSIDLEYRDQKHLVSGFFKEHSEQRTRPTPLLTTDSIKDVLAYAPHGIVEHVDRLLLVLHNRAKRPGYPFLVDSELDYPLAYAHGEQEFSFLLEYLQKRDYLETHDGEEFWFSVAAWERIERLLSGGAESTTCFVAMSFDPAMDEFYDNGFKKAIEECGWTARRVDRTQHSEKICDYIIAEIRRCRFVVADFTGQRAGVYYEAGFAQGLGRSVIWSCQNADKDKLHFDTRQYNHILWEGSGDLYEQLRDRISATILK